MNFPCHLRFTYIWVTCPPCQLASRHEQQEESAKGSGLSLFYLFKPPAENKNNKRSLDTKITKLRRPASHCAVPILVLSFLLLHLR